MILRLAFSVAIHMDPEILLVDEVLAVGDAAFQEKCFNRIHHFCHSGNTLICVSHDPGMLRAICNQAIWLDHGELIMTGAIDEVVEAYQGHRARATLR